MINVVIGIITNEDKEANYIKLDCYRDEEGKYFWNSN